jgi:hypothetical protein
MQLRGKLLSMPELPHHGSLSRDGFESRRTRSVIESY